MARHRSYARLPSLRNDTYDVDPALDASARAVAMLARFGRRPLVHVFAMHAAQPDSPVRAYAERIIVAALTGAGIDTVLDTLHGAASLTLMHATVRASHADYFAVVSETDVGSDGLFYVKCRGQFERRCVAQFSLFVWKCWPQNPAVSMERIAQLTDTQRRALLAYYCPLSLPFDTAKSLVDPRAARAGARRELMARATTGFNIETTLGQRRSVTYDPLVEGTISVHVRAALLAHLHDSDAAETDGAAPVTPSILLLQHDFPSLLMTAHAGASVLPRSGAWSRSLCPQQQPPVRKSKLLPLYRQQRHQSQGDAIVGAQPLLMFRFRVPIPAMTTSVASPRRRGDGGLSTAGLYRLF